MPGSGIWSVAVGIGGVIAFLLGTLAILAVVKCGSIFRQEIRKADLLITEYVRCRDVLLGNRRPSAASGWRTAEGDAFREAWRNFNEHLDAIRSRYFRRTRFFRILVPAFTALAVLDAALLMLAGRSTTDSLQGYVSVTGTAVTWILPPLLAAFVSRLLTGIMQDRTSGNSLVAPWPSELGMSDTNLSAYEKFLPVEMNPAESGSLPEAP